MTKKSFTMVELIVVMVIISIMAAFGVPTFGRAMVKARQRDAINNLRIIRVAQVLNKANTGSYLTKDSIGDINIAFGLTLISTGGTTYICDLIKCTATSLNWGDFCIEVDLLSGNLTCVRYTDTCP